MFHLMTSGHSVLELASGATYTLQSGDFALVPHGAGHRLMSEAGVVRNGLFDLPREAVSPIGKAIRLIQRDPARDWTVESLASAVVMSRSGFAACFTELVEMPAIQYAVEWRMNCARSDLEQQDVTVATVAARYGYQSEAAFSRAFKRIFGVTPGSI